MASVKQHYVVRIEETVRYYYHVEAGSSEQACAEAEQAHVNGQLGLFDLNVESRQASACEVGG
jgi:hypothetical protein